MRRSIRFGLNAAIALVGVLLAGLAALVLSNAPMPIGGTIARLDILQPQDVFYVSGRDLTCTKTAQRDRCEFSLENQPFVVELDHSRPDSINNIAACRTSYAGQTIDCTADYHTIVIGGSQPVVTIPALRFSPTQLQALKQQSVSPRSFIMQIGENSLLRLFTGVAIATGLCLAAVNWAYAQSPRNRSAKLWVSLFLGFGSFLLSWIFWMGLLLATGYVD